MYLANVTALNVFSFLIIFASIALYIINIGIPLFLSPSIEHLLAHHVSYNNGWLRHGRYHQFKGYSIFFKDSVGDAFFNSSKDSMKEISEKPIFVMLHGLITSSYDFSYIYSDLKLKYHVVAVDFLGLGLSDKPQDILYSFEFQAEIIEDLVRTIIRERAMYRSALTINDDKVILLSHDIGVSVAQSLIYHNILNISSSIFLNGGLIAECRHPSTFQKLLQSKFVGPTLQLIFLRKKILINTIKKMFHFTKPPSDSFLELHWELNLHKYGVLLMHKFQNYVNERETFRDLYVQSMVEKSNKISMLHINSPDDEIAGKEMAFCFQNIMQNTSAKLEFLQSNIGHYPHIEDPENVLRLIKQFLE